MANAFSVFITFAAIDHLTAPMRNMAREMGILDKHTEALQKKLNGFKNMAAIGGAITVAGIGMGAGLMHAVNAAGRLEMSIMGVKQALGLTNTEFQKAMNLSQTVGLPTIFSAEQVGDMMKSMATAGLTKQQVLDPNILRQYVNFADVQAQIKHENGPDAISGAVGMAHMFQLYSTQQLSPFLNQLNATLLHTHDTASEFATQFRYIATQARAMGMGASDTLSATAWLGRMGFGSGRGGTNFATFLRQSIFGTGGKHDAAMLQAGLVVNGHSAFENAAGQFVGVPAAVKIMQDLSNRFHGNANILSPLFQKIFGTQGGRIAMMMTGAGASEQYTNVQKQIAGTAGVNSTQEVLNKTWAGQVKQFETTLADIEQNFGRALMPNLLTGLNALNDISGAVLKFTQANPEIMKMAAQFALIATAAALIVGPILVVVGAFGYLATSGIIAAGIGMIAPALVTIGVAAGLLYAAWRTDFLGMQEAAKGLSHSLAGSNLQITIKALKKTWNDFGHDVRLTWKEANEGVKKFFDDLMKGQNTEALLWTDFLNGMKLAWHDFTGPVITDLQKIHDVFNLITGHVTGAGAGVAPPASVEDVSGHLRPHGASAFFGAGPKVLHKHVHGDTHLHGGINVYQQPGQDGRQLAQVIYRELGVMMRNKSYASPDAVLMGTT